MGAFAVVFTGRKHGKIGQSLEALGHGFYGSVETELTKTVQILSKNSRSDRGGGVAPSPLPEYATDFEHLFHSFLHIGIQLMCAKFLREKL